MTDQTRWGIDQVQVRNKAVKYQKDLVKSAMESVIKMDESGKNGSKIITCRLQHTPWPTIMSMEVKSSRELSWYARLTYIIKNSKYKGLN